MRPLQTYSFEGSEENVELDNNNNNTNYGSITNDNASFASRAEGVRKGTVAGVTINTLCNVMGAGVLALPYAVHNGSIVTSLILLLLCAYVSYKAVHILTCACDAVKRYSYTEAVVLNFFPVSKKERSDCQNAQIEPMLAKKRRKFLTLFLELIIVLSCFGTLVVYTRVIGDSVPPVLISLGINNYYVIIVMSWLIPGVIFFIFSCSRSMEELKWTSIIGFGTILYVVFLVIGDYIFLLVHEHRVTRRNSTISWFRVDFGMFATMSTYALAYGYHFNVPYFYRELSDRAPMNMMATVSYSIPLVTASYGIVGVLGYLAFAENVAGHGGGNIVDSFSDTNIAANIGRIGLLFHFATVYPVIAVCARRGLHRFIALSLHHSATPPSVSESPPWENTTTQTVAPVPGDPNTTTRRSIILEAAAIVGLGELCAWYAPGVGTVIDFIGALFGIPTMMIIPGIIGRNIFTPQYRDKWWMKHVNSIAQERIWSSIMVVAGVIFFFGGFFGSVFSTIISPN